MLCMRCSAKRGFSILRSAGNEETPMILRDSRNGPEQPEAMKPPASRRLILLRHRCRAVIVLAVLVLSAIGPILSGRGAARAQGPEAPLRGADGTLLDPSVVWSRLVASRVGDGQDARTVVVLGRPAGAAGVVPDTSRGLRLDMLPREFVRQAVLIAARDELGLATRDEVIDETPAIAKAGGIPAIDVGSVIRDNRSHELVRRVDDKRVEEIFSHETPTAPGRNLELVKLLVAAEALSRDSFPGVLKGMGLEGKPNEIRAAADVPAQAEDRLAAVGFMESLLAVRDLHRAIRNDGESPARLGALARAYALLGVLSEHEWHPAHRAYKARALLYAQRLVARDPNGPWGLWHRAFALALVGRHADALDDLRVAREKADANVAPAAPDWVELIDAYARFDATKLAVPRGRLANLAALLRMFALSYPRSSAAGLNAARAMILQQPYCFRAHDVMSSYHGVSTLHVTTLIGPQALEHFLAIKLPTVDALPRDLRDRLETHPGLLRAVEALDRSGAPDTDPGEPSWGALAHMIRETRFVQVFRRLQFMKGLWSVPVDEFWNEVHLDVAGHRYRPYLETLALAPRDTAESFPRFAEQLDLAEIETSESPMNRALWNLPLPRARAAWGLATAHEDETAEMAVSISEAGDENKVEIARALLKVSPYHPFARATLVVRDWDHVKDQVATWRKQSGEWPAFLAALGQHHTAAGEFDAAQVALARYIELSPDAWAYETLAANFKAQGNLLRWQETLDEFLKNVEDLGLDHARVRVQIADYFMGLKQWDKARPYAEAAAQTWAEWAMNCAARCAEGEKDWEQAEAWYSRVTERYASSAWAVWYFFCKRTGQGDLEGARASVERYIASTADRPDLQTSEYFGYFYWLDGRTDKAREIFTGAYSKSTSISAALALAMILDDEKDAARRDDLLKELVARHKEKAPRSLAICQILLDSIFAPAAKGQPLDIAVLDRLIAAMPEEARGNADFFVGWFLRNHDHPQEARRYLRRCSDSSQSMIWYRYLADESLKRMATK
jgi:tetratricopeptide (TPR) repeat protein